MPKKPHKISHDDLLEILTPSDLAILTSWVWCPDCEHPKIVDYENRIEVNHLSDVILHGKCSKCAKPVSRYIETGEHDDKIKILRKILSKK